MTANYLPPTGSTPPSKESDPSSATQLLQTRGPQSQPPAISAGRIQPARLQRACYSSPGRVRERNEDACSLPLPAADEARWGTLLAVADGVGGLPGGAEASLQAVWYLQALYYAQIGENDPAARLAACVEAVNALNWLSERSGQENAQAGLTTLVAAVAFEQKIWIANVGDSRAYLIQAATQERRQLTEDHSSRNQARKAGIMDDTTLDRLVAEGQLSNSAITRAIGMGERCQVDSYRYAWAPGDCLVLCSDGLTELPESEMVAIALSQPPAEAARLLVERAVAIDGSDNATAAIARQAGQQE